MFDVAPLVSRVSASYLKHILRVARALVAASMSDCGEKAAGRLHPVIFHSHFPSLSKTQTKRFTRTSLSYMLETNSRNSFRKGNQMARAAAKKVKARKRLTGDERRRINPRSGPRLLPRKGLHRDHDQRHPRGLGGDHRIDLPLLRRQGCAGHGAARDAVAGLVR